MPDPWSLAFSGINAAAAGAGAAGSFFGGGGQEGLSRQDQRYLAHQAQIQQALDNDFRMNQMQYRTQDAMKAGLHPLAALGIMPAPGGQAPMAFQAAGPGESFGSRLDRMGQNVSRAISNFQTKEQRAAHDIALRQAAAQAELVEQQAIEARRNNMLPVGTAKPVPANVSFVHPDGHVEVIPSPEYEMARRMQMLPGEWALGEVFGRNMDALTSLNQNFGLPEAQLKDLERRGVYRRRRRLNP